MKSLSNIIRAALKPKIYGCIGRFAEAYKNSEISLDSGCILNGNIYIIENITGSLHGVDFRFRNILNPMDIRLFVFNCQYQHAEYICAPRLHLENR